MVPSVTAIQDSVCLAALPEEEAETGEDVHSPVGFPICVRERDNITLALRICARWGFCLRCCAPVFILLR